MRPQLVAGCVFVMACGAPATGTDGGGDAGPNDAGTEVDAGLDCNGGIMAAHDLAFTEQGAVRGAVSSTGARSFLGIPYAKPPVGSLRWRPPERELTCWSAVRDATQWGAKCPQLPQEQGQPFDAGAPLEGQEDCLTLNVFTPPATDGGLPVMVFIHGGGNTVGSASEPLGMTGAKLYDGAELATRGDVLVITLQYRLGALGYLALTALDTERDAGSSGNYGLLDQQLALGWVQRNAARFGGDPARVMLFGESAGALNTCMHLGLPGSAGLFHRALIESGSCNATPITTKRSEGTRWLAGTNCVAAADVPACIRALTPEQVVRAFPVQVVVGARKPEVSWGPVVDGVVMPLNPLDALRTGAGNAVPLIVGHNADETNLTTPLITTEAEYRAAVTTFVGTALTDQVLQLYPVATYGTPRRALVQVSTDGFFGCQARQASRAAALGHPTVPAWRYLFSRAPVAIRGAFHGVELPYVFQRIAALTPTPSPDDLAVEATLLGYWTRFAATGDPNGAAALTWPPVSSVEPIQRLDVTVSTQSAWRNTECDFFDAFAGVSIPAP